MVKVMVMVVVVGVMVIVMTMAMAMAMRTKIDKCKIRLSICSSFGVGASTLNSHTTIVVARNTVPQNSRKLGSENSLDIDTINPMVKPMV